MLSAEFSNESLKKVAAMNARAGGSVLTAGDQVGINRTMLELLVFSGENEPLQHESAPIRSDDLERLIEQHRHALQIWQELTDAGYAAEKPSFPPQLAELFLRLARKVAANKRWAGHPLIDDAIGDALLRMLLVWNHWDASRGRAYSFLYKVAANRILTAVQKEGRQTRVKDALAEREFVEASRYGTRHAAGASPDHCADAA